MGKRGNNKLTSTLRKSKPVLVVLLTLSLLATFTSCSTITDLLDNRTNEAKVLDAMNSSVDVYSAEVTYEIDISDFEFQGMDPEELQESQMYIDLINKLNIELTYRYDRQELISEVLFEVKLQSTPILEGQIYVDEEIHGFYSPQAYDEALYYEVEDAIDELDDDDSVEAYETFKEVALASSIASDDTYNIEAYQEIIFEFLEEAIDDEVDTDELDLDDGEYNCDVYHIEVDYDEFADVLTDLLEEMMDDEALLESLSALLGSSADYYSSNYDDEDEYDEYYDDDEINLSEVEEDPEEAIEDGADEVLNILEGDGELGEMSGEVEMNIYVDSDEIVRQLESVVDLVIEPEGQDYESISLELEITMVREIVNDEIDFDGIDTDDAVNLLELDDGESEALSEDISNTLESNFSSILGF